MRLLVAALALVALAVPADAAAPVVYAGAPTQGSCLAGPTAVLVFQVDGLAGTGTYQEHTLSCNTVTVFEGGFCDVPVVCSGECEIEADGSATCWFGTARPSVESPNYMHVDAAGHLVGYTYGYRYLDAQVARVA